MSTDENHVAADQIAIIGMTGRFPGAKNIEALWENLRQGVESAVTFSDDQLLAAGIDPAVLADPHYVKAGTVLEDVDLFDASFFGFNPREAEVTDPQHRIFLECAHEALEIAGYAPENYGGAIGVFAGSTMSSYLGNNLHRNRQLMQSVSPLQVLMGTDKDFLPTRVSYKLNLRGPSVNVQTACSTSLVAVHLACQSLLEHACDIALAGGVCIQFPMPKGYPYEEEGILSDDGHCRAFDAKARGAIPGNGVGVVVLKRLDDALTDGDRILAVIKGSAINNDGSLKVGYTAPSVSGQAEVIATAHAIAGVDPTSITYVETHGTGTLLGDPVEVSALTQAFRWSTSAKHFCAIGSIKTNLGHLDAAAGATGLIKTVLQLQHKQLAPSLNFERPNPNIDFANSPFYVNDRLQEWKSGNEPRRAGVSAFGLGGTNAHVIVEEAPEAPQTSPSRPLQLLTISAKTPTALDAAMAELAEHLKRNPELDLADVCFTQHLGRTAFAHRCAALCDGVLDSAAVLEGEHAERLWRSADVPPEREVVFMFPGGGAQYPNMGRELYDREATYRAEIDRCAELFQAHLGSDIRSLLYPTEDRVDEAAIKLRQTGFGLPALFATEYAQARQWMAWGIHPEAMIGHSLGEYVAACLAGVMSLEDAVALVAARSSLMQKLPNGAMSVIECAESEIQPLLGPDLSIAAVNGPSLCVVSGPVPALEAFEQRIAERGKEGHRLHIDVASHCALVCQILDEFSALTSSLNFQAPQIPYISNVTGTWMNSEAACDPRYWGRHLRNTVRFADGLSELFKRPGRVLLEVGPGHTLSMLANQHPAKTPEHLVLASQRHPQDCQSDLRFLLTTLGQLWLAGVKVDWQAFHQHERRQRVLLPTYPFERQRYWVEPVESQDISAARDWSDRRPGVQDFFYVPTWKQAVHSISQQKMSPFPTGGNNWLIFADTLGVGTQLVNRLRQAGHKVVQVVPGSTFGITPDGVFTIDLAQPTHYENVLKELRALDALPDHIVHLWGVVAPDEPEENTVERLQERGFFSLLLLTQALDNQGVRRPLQFTAVTNNACRVNTELCVFPQKSTVAGFCRVVPQEYPHITARQIDIDWHETLTDTEHTTDVLINEIAAKHEFGIVAVRGHECWVQNFEAVRLGPADATELPLRLGGVYLITGGLGGIGLEIADYLAREFRAKLVLLGRSTFPEEEDWSSWLASHNEEDDLSRKIIRLKQLQESGAELLVISADVADRTAMAAALHRINNRFGHIHGVIHAAGIPGGGLIQLTTVGSASKVLRPKVQGTLVLHELLADCELDFLVLCSSLSSLLGGVGHVEYCAANSFLDSFAQAQRHNRKTVVTSVLWNPWQAIGMAASVKLPSDLRAWQEEVHRKGITAREGADAFSRILAARVPQVAVCTQNLTTLIEQRYSLGPAAQMHEAAKSDNRTKAHARPALTLAYVAPRNEIEQQVAEIWQAMLGIEPIGIHDNFFHLGGHSLLGTRIISRIRDTFKVEVGLRRLFEAPTVCALAETVAKLQTDTTDAIDSEVLNKLQSLTEAEIDAELQRRSSAVSAGGIGSR